MYYGKTRAPIIELRGTPVVTATGCEEALPTSPKMFYRLGICLGFLAWDQQYHSLEAYSRIELSKAQTNSLRAAYEVQPLLYVFVRRFTTVSISEMHGSFGGETMAQTV